MDKTTVAEAPLRHDGARTDWIEAVQRARAQATTLSVGIINARLRAWREAAERRRAAK
jgi:hypothetical protein